MFEGFVNGQYVARKIIKGAWRPWFAWHPVKIQGRRVWMTTVYRRTIDTYVDTNFWQRYEYGTLFDVIKGD